MKIIRPLLLATAVLLCSSAFPSILVYDGFPTGTGGYSNTQNQLKGNAITHPDVIGFTSTKWQNDNTGVVFSMGADYGLNFPECFAEYGFSAVGTSAGYNNGDSITENAGELRAQWKAVNTDAFSEKQTIYLRGLLQAGTSAENTYPESSSVMDQNDNHSFHWSFGLAGNSGNNTIDTSKTVQLGISKFNGKLSAGLMIASADGSSFACYPLCDMEMGKTYVAFAKILLNADATGNEYIQAFAMAAEDYTPCTEADLESRYASSVGTGGVAALNIIDSFESFKYIGLSGLYQTKNTRIMMDEIGVAEFPDDLIPILPPEDGSPILEGLSVALSVNNANRSLTAALSTRSGAADLYACYRCADGSETEELLATNVQPGAAAQTYPLTQMPVDKTVTVFIAAKNNLGNNVEEAGVAYNGALTLELVQSPTEYDMVPAQVKISRKDTGRGFSVSLHTTDGTAVAGVDYTAFSGSVAFADGADSVIVEIPTRINVATMQDTTYRLILDPGTQYLLPDSPELEVSIKNVELGSEYNIWIAPAEGDGLASTASNWSYGRVPSEEDKIELSLFSTTDMTWDAGVNGLPVRVASWKQTTDYTGTVTFTTQYTGDFTCFEITGNAEVNGGSWTHLANDDAQTYRLYVSAGGNFTLGETALLDARFKGYAKEKMPEGGALGVHAGGTSSAPVYGSVTAPESIGSGGTAAAGGGAIRIDAAGEAALNGTIRVNSPENNNSWTSTRAGAPGSVYIRAASISGTGNIYACASKVEGSDASRGISGGRIALVATSADTLSFNTQNCYIYGALARTTRSGGGGTLYTKTASQPHGTLTIDNEFRKYDHTCYIMFPTIFGTTYIPAGETWTFDSLVFKNAGILTVPAGTKLVLPNGFASVSGNSTLGGILMRGGEIDAGNEDPYVLQTAWTLSSEEPYTLNRDTVVRDGASIGGLTLYSTIGNTRQTKISVEGDLTVEENGKLSATATGLNHVTPTPTNFHNGLFAHGGQIGAYGSENMVYGSILHPSLPGNFSYITDSDHQLLGGGALKLTVSGTLTLDGIAEANPLNAPVHAMGTGSGGSLDLEVGALRGSGSILATGHVPNYAATPSDSFETVKRELRGCTPGGRIAVRVTGNGETISDDWKARISAVGAEKFTGNWAGRADASSSAGTIYLQDGDEAEGCGTVLIRDSGTAENNLSRTPFPSTVEAVPASEDENAPNAEDFEKATLRLENFARVCITQDVRLRSVQIEDTSFIDLRGNTITVNRLSIGNTQVPFGTYSADAEIFGDSIIDTSASGTVKVLGEATMITIY